MKLIKIVQPAKKQKPDQPLPILNVKNTKNQIALNTQDFLDPSLKKEIRDLSIRSYALNIFKEKILHKKNIWAIYKFGQKDWDLLVKNKSNYENYVCGYL